MKAIDTDMIGKQIDVEIAGERDDIRIAERHEDQAAKSRASAKARRLRIGGLLAKARGAWPERGPNAKGWGEFLAARKIDDATARRYIDEYTDPDGFAQKQRKLSENPRAGADDPDPGPSSANVDDDEPDDPDPDEDIDRDTWCTPPWLVGPLGSFDLDPCSNERSTVKAAAAFDLDRRGEDGLGKSMTVPATARVFINPPYSTVPPWIAAYKHTRFCFLLKLDTSTRWFAELHAATSLILIPRRRVNFIPPPGVPAKKAVAQQFPHALFYAHAEDATDAIRALCWHWHTAHSAAQAQPALHIVR